MNVDILSKNPSWTWYIVFAVPFMVFVLLGWILFKYVPVRDHSTTLAVKYSPLHRLVNGLRTILDRAWNANPSPPTQLNHHLAGLWCELPTSRLDVEIGGKPVSK